MKTKVLEKNIHTGEIKNVGTDTLISSQFSHGHNLQTVTYRRIFLGMGVPGQHSNIKTAEYNNKLTKEEKEIVKTKITI